MAKAVKWRQGRAKWCRVSFALALLPLAACDCGGGAFGEGAPCTTRGDCEAGFSCVDGRCVRPEAPPDCSSDEECPAGWSCEGGLCRDRTGRCTDGDGDGVCADLDCDDTDPTQTGRELCDGEDNDCDGEVDEGVLNACGNCVPGCTPSELGAGRDRGFDLEGDESDGVGLDDEGALVLDVRRINTNVIWIANTRASQVVKVDTNTCEELGRYWTDSDPSRTTVDPYGDVYVGNRGGMSVTKVSVLGADCPDTNGDGTVTTSSGGGDIRGAGPADRFQDDCVLWHTELPGGGIIRAMAAQAVDVPDGEPKMYVWVGGWSNRIWKLDGDTGEVLVDTPSPIPPYGFALDAEGRLWISGLWGDLGMVDTTRCTSSADCAVDICRAGNLEDDSCDGAVKARWPMGSTGYGITVDFMQRVWIAGSPIKRYDPAAAPGSRLQTVDVGTFCNGIGADARGFVYAACQGAGTIARIDANTLAFTNVPTGPNRGIGIDADGKVWGINLSNGLPTANVLTPGIGLMDNSVSRCGPVLSAPYTYSDMTGLQLRLAANPRGYYRHVFDACPDAEGVARWLALDFRVETPAGTEVRFRVRTAETREALASAEWVVAATVPPDASPISLEDVLSAAGITPAKFLELEIVLRSTRTSGMEVATPRVLSVGVQSTCGLALE